MAARRWRYRGVWTRRHRLDASPASAGCLAAIREGWAGLVTSHADVLSQLDASSQLVRGALEAAGHADATRSPTLFDTNLTGAQQTIVQTLRKADGALVVDQIAARCDLPLSRILADLTLLEIRGRVRNDREGQSRQWGTSQTGNRRKYRRQLRDGNDHTHGNLGKPLVGSRPAIRWTNRPDRHLESHG